MKVTFTLQEASLIVADSVGTKVRDELGLANVTAEIVVPKPEAPHHYRNVIAAVRAIREDWNARNDHLSLSEAKRLVDLVLNAASLTQ